MQIIHNGKRRSTVIADDIPCLMKRKGDGSFSIEVSDAEGSYSVVLTKDDMAFVARSAERMESFDLDLTMRA